ncbi:hypothetical protein CLAIMM_07760, partial [Cladophialophora immunda]
MSAHGHLWTRFQGPEEGSADKYKEERMGEAKHLGTCNKRSICLPEQDCQLRGNQLAQNRQWSVALVRDSLASRSSTPVVREGNRGIKNFRAAASWCQCFAGTI